MPQIPLYPRSSSHQLTPTAQNPLPSILHTPTGLALLELQGTIHFPVPSTSTPAASASTSAFTPHAPSTRIGHLSFPLYNPSLHGEEDTKWMKMVYFYVGENQRLVGEVKKLGKPFAIIRRRQLGQGIESDAEGENMDVDGTPGDKTDQAKIGELEGLEVVEIVKWKIVFSTRPEPVGGSIHR